MPKDDSRQLVKESHYMVRSLSTREETLKTTGYFKGYLQLGKRQALKMELDDDHEDEGTIRVIPCHMITHIDIIDQAEPAEDSGKETSTAYFG